MHERMEFPWKVAEAGAIQAIGKAFTGIVSGRGEEEAPASIEAHEHIPQMIQLLNEAEHWLSFDEHSEGSQEMATRIREFLQRVEVKEC